MTTTSNFGQELVSLRQRAGGLTQEQLARAIGISTTFASKIERGERDPGANTVIRIANYFAVQHGIPLSVNRLLELSGNTKIECAALAA
jgi:transcriptional regulator with XRE-family HTH domain